MKQVLALAAIEWTRPAGLAALALPLFVLLFARRRPLSLLLATGTLEVWSRIERRSAAASGARQRIPLAIWLLAAALAAGALALAGPRLRVERAAVTWSVVVDRSPSMYLADGAATRIEKALALARAELERAMQPGDVIRWSAGMRADPTATISSEPPAAWLVAPAIVLAEPTWSDHDEPGWIWVTDRVPAERPRFARVCASGGRAAPGPVAVEGTTRWDWNGAELVLLPGAALSRAVRIQGDTALPEPVVAVFETWRTARGLDLAAGAQAAALTLRASVGGLARTVFASRDGWSSRGLAHGTAASADLDGPLELWLAAREPEAQDEVRTLVTVGAGRIECALFELDEPAGDPAAFAVSWARLFDDALLPARDVIALEERVFAGDGAWIEPTEGRIEGRDSNAQASVWPAVCAFVALLLALAAVVVKCSRTVPRTLLD